MHPAVGVDGLGGAFGVVPVAQHHRVAPGLELAAGASGHDHAGGRVDDADLDVGVDPPDGGDPLLEGVVGGGLGGHRGMSRSCRRRW